LDSDIIEAFSQESDNNQSDEEIKESIKEKLPN
jgi:hypothetical protein